MARQIGDPLPPIPEVCECGEAFPHPGFQPGAPGYEPYTCQKCGKRYLDPVVIDGPLEVPPNLVPLKNPHLTSPGWDRDWAELLAECSPEVRIGKHVLFLSPAMVVLRGRVRVDPFSLIVGGLHAGDGVHLAPYTFINGGAQKAILGRWAFAGAGSRLITASDDYSGSFGPIGPWGRNQVDHADITFRDFSGVAVGTTVLPGVTLPEGACVAGHGWVTVEVARQMEPWAVYACPPGAHEPKFLFGRDSTAVREAAEDPAFQRGNG